MSGIVKVGKIQSSEVMTVPLVGGGYAMIDERDFCLVRHERWYRHSAGYASAYLRTGPKKKARGRTPHPPRLMHRVIANAPRGAVVDHINSVKLDNRLSNLRVCTQSENMRNASGHRDRASRFRGVTRHGRGFIVMLHKRYVGWRKTEVDAAMLWDKCAREAGVNERHMNFPRSAPCQV